MKKLVTITAILLVSVTVVMAQKRIINIPDIPGYITLKCDFHIHTVFSDGNVWPTYRVNEAWEDGLDALAISDHIEYLPHKEYITTDHNAAYDIASNLARERNLILIRATEITRPMPPGHLNALFLEDASLVYDKDPYKSIEKAALQGAFIQWNHPGWKSQEPDGIPKLYDIHRRLLAEGYIHGIEFFNSSEYYTEVLEWCREYNLAVIASSDEHNIISERYGDNLRPMTLVFSRERSAGAIREALFEARTLAFFDNNLAGNDSLLNRVFHASVKVGESYHENRKYQWFEVVNDSDITYYLVNGNPGTPNNITLKANSVISVRIEKGKATLLEYDVSNMLTGYDTRLRVLLKSL